MNFYFISRIRKKGNDDEICVYGMGGIFRASHSGTRREINEENEIK